MLKALPAASVKQRWTLPGVRWMIDHNPLYTPRYELVDGAGDEHPEILRERLDWMPAGATLPLVLDLNEIFREARLRDG